MEDSFQKKKTNSVSRGNFSVTLQLAWEDMVDMQGGYRLLICTDVPPHIHKRVTTVTGSPSPGVRLRSLRLGPSTLHAALFDSDGSWRPGDIRGCNNINALRQVFKSGTCLIIITTYVLFIALQRDKSSWCSLDSCVFSSPPSHPPSCLSSFPVLGEERRATVWEEDEGAGGEWWGQRWSANHLFTFGICIMRQGANGSPGWLETGWHAFSFNGHAEETSNPSWHFS